MKTKETGKEPYMMVWVVIYFYNIVVSETDKKGSKFIFVETLG